MATYIIADGRPVARAQAHTPAGPCRYAFQRSAEAIDANREWNLVNARRAKTSSAKKWQNWEADNGVELPVAIELNPGEYFISE